MVRYSEVVSFRTGRQRGSMGLHDTCPGRPGGVVGAGAGHGTPRAGGARLALGSGGIGVQYFPDEALCGRAS